MVVDDLLVTKRSVVHCPPHLCLISTDYENYDLCLAFRLQVSWDLGIDFKHNWSIRSYGVIFPEIKEHGYEKLKIPVHEAKHYSLPSYNPKGHLKVKDIS